MSKDYSNIKYSCPFLDEVISNINEAEKRIEKGNVALEYLYDCYGKNSPIEKARAIHDELREWGNGLYHELEQAKADAEHYEKEYNKTLADADYYKTLYEDLQKQLELTTTL